MVDCKVQDLTPLYSKENLIHVVMGRELEAEIERLTAVYGEPEFEIEYIEDSVF